MDAHNAIVTKVAERVKQFHAQQKPFRLYHGATNSTRYSHRNADNTVDTSKLNHVLSVDTATKTAIVEPNVPMDQLVAEALKHGLLPPVVMELPGITTGGGFSGTSGESSSFRYGAFDATMNWIEIVLPTGEVTKASKTERQDIFWGAASAFGTLGVVTLLQIQLIDAKKYVELDYSVSPTAETAVTRIQEECNKPTNDFVDGIVYTLDATVIMAGRLVDTVPQGVTPRQFMRRKDPWFYIRAERVMKQIQKSKDKTEIVTDYIPIFDYLFRYDRGGFWSAKSAFSYFKTPFNRITRYLLDPFMHTRDMYRALHKSGLADINILQDVGIPYEHVPAFYEWLDKSFKIYPIWLCPLRLQRDGGASAAHGLHSEFAGENVPTLLNFGVWGPVPGNRREVMLKNRKLEAKVQEYQGKKWLYAHAYYPTPEEFWAHYDRTSYDALRKKYGAEYLPSVYDKVKIDLDAEEALERADTRAKVKAKLWKVWPVRGLYGVYCVVRNREYVLEKKRGKDGKHVEGNGVNATSDGEKVKPNGSNP